MRVLSFPRIRGEGASLPMTADARGSDWYRFYIRSASLQMKYWPQLVFVVLPWIVVIWQTLLLWQTQGFLRAANGRADRAMQIAERFEQAAHDFEAINTRNVTNLERCTAILQEMR